MIKWMIVIFIVYIEMIKWHDKIIYKNVESEFDYKLILEGIENKEIDEIR